MDGSGGGAGASASSGGFTPPATATISIHGAAISPAMVGGDEWDGPGQVPEGVITDTFDQMGLGYGAVVEYLTNLAADGYAPPDPFGVAQRWQDGALIEPIALGTEDTNDEDTFAPNWVDSRWYGVPVDQDMRLEFTLWDEDLSENDTIGTVQLNYDHVIAALQQAEVLGIRTDEQGSGRILFVAISAVPE
jgi:hypothetical protein